MGLLDVFNTDEGRFNLGLLAAAAPRADNAGFGQRLNEAMSGLDARKSEKLKSDLLAAQMQHYNAQSKHLENADALALQKQTQIEGALKDVFGGTSPGAYTMPQGGGPVMPPQQGGLGNTSIDQVARLHAMGGPNLMDAFKWINEPQKFESGSTYTSRKDGTERQMPKLGEGMVGDSKGVSMAPGYLDSFGAVKNEEERAKANFQLLPRDMVDTGSGRPIGGTVGQYVNSQKPQPTGLQNEQPGNLTPAMQQAIMADWEKNGGPRPTVGMYGAKPGQAFDFSGKQRLQSVPEAKAAEAEAVLPSAAQGEVNKAWLETSYKPVVEKGNAASGTISNIQASRQALETMGKTGWGTETKLAAANILVGMGFAPKNAELYASSGQVFQAQAMSRLMEVQAAQKGAQTEHDAKRIDGTFAQLKNTPQANAFILDLNEALAQREKQRANFYSNALPIATKKGDLLEVEREWQKRGGSQSVFDSPIMQRWKGGVK